MIDLAPLFTRQAEACDRLGSPFMGRLLRLCGDRLAPGDAVADRLFNWPGDPTGTGDALALRFAGALHALILMKQDPDLAAAYPPNVVDDATLWQAVVGAMTQHRDHMMHWLDSAPQTNEVRRSTAMIAATQVLAARFPGLPFRLSELGASAGLNLWFDHYALALPDGTTRGAADPVLTLTPGWTGPLPPQAEVTIADRRGIDLNPLSPDRDEDRLRLASYTWPDQPDRMARLNAALALAEPVVDRGDAAGWLATRLEHPTPGQIDLVFHTIAWQYFPAATDAALRATLAESGARARPDAPLAHLSVEFEDGKSLATVRLTVWTGAAPQVLDLGLMNAHGIAFEAAEPFAL